MRFEPDFAQTVALLALAGMLGYWLGLQRAWRDQEQSDLRRQVGELQAAEWARQHPEHARGAAQG
jgi:hypothetical protein